MHANGSAPPVDLEGFRTAMRAAGIEDVVEPTLEVYYAEARATFEGLSHAIESRDSEAARAAAHALKSSSGNIRAHGAASLFERLEDAARAGELDAILATFQELRPEFERVIGYLAEVGVGR